MDPEPANAEPNRRIMLAATGWRAVCTVDETEMGAIEFLASEVRAQGSAIADALNRLADAVADRES